MRASVNCGNNEIIVGFTPINVARIGWKFFEGRGALMSRVRTFSRGIEGQWPPLSSVDRVSTPSGTGKVKKNNLRFTVKVETSIVCRMGPLMRIRASSYERSTCSGHVFSSKFPTIVFTRLGKFESRGGFEGILSTFVIDDGIFTFTILSVTLKYLVKFQDWIFVSSFKTVKIVRVINAPAIFVCDRNFSTRRSIRRSKGKSSAGSLSPIQWNRRPHWNVSSICEHLTARVSFVESNVASDRAHVTHVSTGSPLTEDEWRFAHDQAR